MQMIIDKKELTDSYPLIERTISIDDCSAIVDFELIGDLCFTFTKKYKSLEDVLVAIRKFINTEKETSYKLDFEYMSFQEKLFFSKKKIMTDILNQDISLPDGGKEFKYNGDMDYIKHLLDEINTYAFTLEKLILNNKNDLIEDTFCYKLFEECVFDDRLYLDLINNIRLYLILHQALDRKKDREIYGIISWIICNIYNCIIAHNDENDLYHIKNFDMNLWKNSYSDKLSDLTKRIIVET